MLFCIKNAFIAFVYFLMVSSASGADNTSTTSPVDSVYHQYITAAYNMDAQAISHLYAENAAYLTAEKTSAIHYGPSAVIRDMAEFLANAKKRGERIGFSFRITSRSASVDMICDVGYYRIDAIKDADKHPVLFGKMVNVFRKQVDGSWLFQVDSYSETTEENYLNAQNTIDYGYQRVVNK